MNEFLHFTEMQAALALGPVLKRQTSARLKWEQLQDHMLENTGTSAL